MYIYVSACYIYVCVYIMFSVTAILLIIKTTKL